MESITALNANHEFCELTFARTIESLRQRIAERLYDLIIVRCDLVKHLRATRDYCFVGKGDFFVKFVLEMDSFFHTPLPRNHDMGMYLVLLIKDWLCLFSLKS